MLASAIDLAVLVLEALARRNVNITALATEVNAAHAEGRDANVEPFKQAADAAQARATEHFGQ